MTNPADRDPVLMAVADGVMDWRLYPKARALRDAIYAALLSERHRAEEAMRERPRPLDEWAEEDGNVLWWFFPMTEAPYVGSPLDLGRSYAVEMGIGDQTVTGVVTLGGWPGYHTHFTPLPALPLTPEPTHER